MGADQQCVGGGGVVHTVHPPEAPEMEASHAGSQPFLRIRAWIKILNTRAQGSCPGWRSPTRSVTVNVGEVMHTWKLSIWPLSWSLPCVLLLLSESKLSTFPVITVTQSTSTFREFRESSGSCGTEGGFDDPLNMQWASELCAAPHGLWSF